MRENRLSGSEGGGAERNQLSLPLSGEIGGWGSIWIRGDRRAEASYIKQVGRVGVYQPLSIG